MTEHELYIITQSIKYMETSNPWPCHSLPGGLVKAERRGVPTKQVPVLLCISQSEREAGTCHGMVERPNITVGVNESHTN